MGGHGCFVFASHFPDPVCRGVSSEPSIPQIREGTLGLGFRFGVRVFGVGAFSQVP